MVLPSTRDLVARTRSSSPLESLHREESQREEQREDGGRKNPLNVNRMRAICTRIREFLMLMPGESPALGITAEWKRKDSPNSEIRKTTAKVRKEGLDLWENEASKEYPFPHPDMNYYDIEIDSEINQEQMEEEAQVENEIGEHMDPNNLDPYEPITFEAWIMSADKFKVRDLIRELKDAPEFGLRIDQFFVDRTFIKQQERNFENLFVKWIIYAR